MEKLRLPLLPVRDVVIFPHAKVPISLKREKSVAALERSISADKKIFLSMQKDKDIDGPTKADLFSVGTIAKVIQIQRQPDGIINILVEGESKAKVVKFVKETPYFEVEVSPVSEIKYPKEELEKLIRPLVEKFRQLITMGKPVPLDKSSSIVSLCIGANEGYLRSSSAMNI